MTDNLTVTMSVANQDGTKTELVRIFKYDERESEDNLGSMFDDFLRAQSEFCREHVEVNLPIYFDGLTHTKELKARLV